uniref:Brain protein I3 n=1 Tax=Strongyloides papillosus TaxID=174720 RepID=A0A0N5C9J3_STREA
MIPVQQISYPPVGFIQPEGTINNGFPQPNAPPSEVYPNGYQQSRPPSTNTYQSQTNLHEQNPKSANSVHDPPPPYTPQPLAPTPHPIPIAIPMPVIQPLSNPNIIVNNGNENGVRGGSGGTNGQSPQQIAALINMQIVKCPFCGLGTLQRKIKYPQLIIFLLISVFLFPLGLCVWCCLFCNSIYKRSCTNCGVEA